MTSSGHRQVSSLAEFHAWVREFAGLLQGHEILLLSGPLGAGKTEFVKTLASVHGVSGVQSPTFALHHAVKLGPWRLDHFDLYRLENVDDLESTGFWDLLQSPSLVVVEWPERVPPEFWPRDRVTYRIEIKKTGENSREVLWTQMN